jgi:hypothetical protein
MWYLPILTFLSRMLFDVPGDLPFTAIPFIGLEPIDSGAYEMAWITI